MHVKQVGTARPSDIGQDFPVYWRSARKLKPPQNLHHPTALTGTRPRWTLRAGNFFKRGRNGHFDSTGDTGEHGSG